MLNDLLSATKKNSITIRLIQPGNDGEVRKLDAGAHEETDIFVTYSRQPADVAHEIAPNFPLVVVGVRRRA